MTNPGLRASDDDRHTVVAALERHTSAGRLSLEEFSDRVGLVYAAATHADLAKLTRDLPVEPTPVPVRSPEYRQLLIAFLLAALTIAVLGVILAVAK